ncbi:MAG: nuclear transport factor 2 family protein [SAR324 cluster bacterium]|nr:nuclear transport factor 2 family protein [SAR324 cluster bacterium]MCH8887981.1 nuclear transport factor 2 family protein [SAR324 cluster bacterium]
MNDRLTEDSLLAANERFYRTFERLDYPALAALWEESERTFCLHPGWMPLFGPKAVMDSWRRIIANTAEIHFTLTGAQALICGEIGVVTVFESIQNVSGDERTSSGTFATNLFAYEKDQARWMLFHHHASHSASPHEMEEGTLLV